MKPARRCVGEIPPKGGGLSQIPPLGCCGGRAIPTLRRLAAGWLPSQCLHWLSSVLNSKTEWPCWPDAYTLTPTTLRMPSPRGSQNHHTQTKPLHTCPPVSSSSPSTCF